MHKSHATSHDVSLVLDIRLSTLIFMSLTTSGTHGLLISRVSHSGGGGGMAGAPTSHDFFQSHPIKADTPHPTPPPIGGYSSLKITPFTLPLKNKAPFKRMIPRKKTQKSETVINTCVNTCVPLIKQH